MAQGHITKTMIWSRTSKRCTASLAHKLLDYFAWHNYDHDHDNVDDNVHDHVHVYDDERDVIYPTVLMLLFFLRVCPIFQISNVTGENLDLLKMFLNLLSIRAHFKKDVPSEFQIDDTYSVPVGGSFVNTLFWIYLLLRQFVFLCTPKVSRRALYYLKLVQFTCKSLLQMHAAFEIKRENGNTGVINVIIYQTRKTVFDTVPITEKKSLTNYEVFGNVVKHCVWYIFSTETKSKERWELKS